MKLVSRQEWGALPPRNNPRLNLDNTYLIAHHSVYPTFMAPFQQIRQIQQQHLNEKNPDGSWTYNDIAYSMLVDVWGTAYVGRGWGFSHGANGEVTTPLGISLGIDNRNSRSICFMGHGDEISEAAKQTIRELVQDAEEVFRTSLPRYGHMDLSATGCPGAGYYQWFKTMNPIQPATDESEDMPSFSVVPEWVNYQGEGDHISHYRVVVDGFTGKALFQASGTCNIHGVIPSDGISTVPLGVPIGEITGLNMSADGKRAIVTGLGWNTWAFETDRENQPLSIPAAQVNEDAIAQKAYNILRDKLTD